MRETDPRFMNLKGKVGLFFIVAVIGIITTVVFIGIERGIFTPRYKISFTVDKGTGFFEGMPVKLSGFKIGKIDSLSLDENARVKVTLVIYKKYSKWIRQDSKAILTKEGFIGEGIIDVTVGDMSKPAIEDGGVIQYEKARGIDELVAEMRPVIVEIKDIISYINDPQGDIKQTLANLKTLSAGLNTTRENADNLIKNADSSISNLSSGASKTLKNVDSLVTSMNEKMNPVMDKLNRTMDNAEKATASLKDAVEKTAPKVPPLVDKGEDTLSDTNEVIRSLKQMWPIRLFIEKPKDGLIHGDSYE